MKLSSRASTDCRSQHDLLKILFISFQFFCFISSSVLSFLLSRHFFCLVSSSVLPVPLSCQFLCLVSSSVMSALLSCQFFCLVHFRASMSLMSRSTFVHGPCPTSLFCPSHAGVWWSQTASVSETSSCFWAKTGIVYTPLLVARCDSWPADVFLLSSDKDISGNVRGHLWSRQLVMYCVHELLVWTSFSNVHFLFISYSYLVHIL